MAHKIAQEGSFRSSLNGFHKADVLQYIDAVKNRHTKEMQELEQQLTQLQQTVSQLEDQVSTASQQCEQWQTRTAELEQMNESLSRKQDDMARLTADCHRLAQEADILLLEKQDLTDRLNEAKSRLSTVKELEQQLHLAEAQVQHLSQIEQDKTKSVQRLQQDLAVREQQYRQALADNEEKFQQELLSLKTSLAQKEQDAAQAEKKIAALEADQQRYDRLTGDVGAFILELHTMGQRFLETAFRRSDGCLDAVESAVGSLLVQLSDARTRVESARQELLDQGNIAGMRLDELVQSLEETAGGKTTA